MKKNQVYNMVLSALFIALGYVLPYLTMQIPSLGSMLLPMHIPALLCGFVCGWPYALIVGFVTPLLRALTLGMPPLFPTAVAMAFELAAYGALAGVLFRLFPKKIGYIYASLLLAMIGGRVVWGLASVVLYGIAGNPFTFSAFAAGAALNAIPGIILQIVLIPPLVVALDKAKLIKNN